MSGFLLPPYVAALTAATLLLTLTSHSLAGHAPISPLAPKPDTPKQPEYVSHMTGSYDLWLDGEGGASCSVTFDNANTIGGFVLSADEDCASKLTLTGDPHAWFINNEGQLVIIDATRKALLRMNALDDGSYKDPRDGDYVNAVLLTRP